MDLGGAAVMIFALENQSSAMQGFLALEKLRIVKLLRVIGRALFIRRRRGNLKNAGRGGVNKS